MLVHNKTIAVQTGSGEWERRSGKDEVGERSSSEQPTTAEKPSLSSFQGRKDGTVYIYMYVYDYCQLCNIYIHKTSAVILCKLRLSKQVKHQRHQEKRSPTARELCAGQRTSEISRKTKSSSQGASFGSANIRSIKKNDVIRPGN